MLIREAGVEDDPAIAALTRAVFVGQPYANGTEPLIPARLRREGDLLFDLVGLADGAIVAHVALSRAEVGGHAGWAALGPVSVAPDRQRRGLGSTIIAAALSRLREAGAAGCVLVGDPGYYSRFGFRSAPGLHVAGIPDRFVQALPFGPEPARGEIVFAPAFGIG